MSFADVANLQLPVLSIFAQLMSSVMEALRRSKAAVHLQADDVQLSPHSALFALMDSAVPVAACHPEKPLLYPAATSRLPDTIRELFRVVSVMTLDFQLSLEVMLFSQGRLCLVGLVGCFVVFCVCVVVLLLLRREWMVLLLVGFVVFVCVCVCVFYKFLFIIIVIPFLWGIFLWSFPAALFLLSLFLRPDITSVVEWVLLLLLL